MLKFFRKIRQSLLGKASIRKYLIYAIGEILLVVIGILIALQVNTWNEERKREKEENQYLNSLLNDFETAESSFQLILGAVQEQLNHNEQLLVLLAEPEGSTPTDSLVGMLRKSFIDVPFGIQVTAYNDLVNSGKLSILQSEELRRALSNFEIVNALANSYSEKAADQWAGQVTEFFVNRFNVSTIYGEDSDVIWEYPGIPHSSGYEKTPINKRFSSDKEAVWSRELANRIAIKNVLLEDAARSAKDVLILIDEIKLLISSSLRNNK
ncbi:hypothetical protein E4S40_15490 [Algoriphagus kandeliae]|uniref:Uncharacterized protein n=1 Tax=Algoriphagus kandeliae TaxID=2562278 RepID=A0A4Y9QRU9_9BACT|nr:DUF6090 family protein [Algoriphagus kandeliae]TFV93645.1 hypothetical protein E4S40_15490 [Algoriphagus kandeliae]